MMGHVAFGNFAGRDHPVPLGQNGSNVCRLPGSDSLSTPRADRDASHVRAIRAVQSARRRRDALFGTELFADPAWDMLLELYAVHIEQQRVSVSSLCIAAYVPATTALRWVAKLEQEGLAVRVDDPRDARRTWIELSEAGIARMQRYFDLLPLAPVSA